MENRIIKVPVVILLKESLLVSWGRDLFTFGWLLGGLWLNHNYLGGSVVITVTLCIGLFVFAASHNKSRLTIDQALEKLQAMKREAPNE